MASRPERPSYDVVIGINYYAPYVSGVTEAARVTAEGLAQRGWRVLVVCAHHDPETPRAETINGVDVVRTRVIARIGKGVISPSFTSTLARWAKRAGVVHLHLPMLDAAAVVRAVGRRAPVVATYHCDVNLPPGAVNRFQVAMLDRSHRFAMRRAAAICVTSDDYAAASRLAGDLAGRTTEIPPASVLRRRGEPSFRDGDGLHVGFLGRIVEEKGLEYLVAGFRQLGPEARLLIGGDFAKVAGGSVVEQVRAAIDDDPRIRMLGFVPDEAVPDFYASLDVFALTSVNSLEAFGIVQVEAMMLGVPALASDLPGVRLPVQRTGFGVVVPPRNADAIAAGLRQLESADLDREAGSARTQELYLDRRVVDLHAELFTRVIADGAPTVSKPSGG